MKRLRFSSCALFLVMSLSAVASGCSGGGIHAHGNVTLDGAPVDGGKITFTSMVEGTSETPANASADITGGKYALDAAHGLKAGKYRVEISWKKKTGKKIATPGDQSVTMDEVLEIVPAKYNSQSKESIDVQSGTDTFDFALTSK